MMVMSTAYARLFILQLAKSVDKIFDDQNGFLVDVGKLNSHFKLAGFTIQQMDNLAFEIDKILFESKGQFDILIRFNRKMGFQ
mgnify:CR=1 FL=1